MQANMHMTIQDYFRQIRGHSIAHRSDSDRMPDTQETDRSFARILDRKKSTSEVRHRGLTIRDYLSKPVTVRPPVIQMDAVPGRKDEAPRPAAPSPPAGKPETNSDSLSIDPPPPGVAHSQLGSADVTDRIESSIATAAKRYNLPTVLVRAVVKAESGFRVRAVSPAGAQGLMQLMPATARELGVTDPFDIDQNIDGGAKYLRAMLDRFGGDVKLALSAYNAGPGTVARYNGKVPYAETRNYVDRVLRFAGRST